MATTPAKKATSPVKKTVAKAAPSEGRARRPRAGPRRQRRDQGRTGEGRRPRRRPRAAARRRLRQRQQGAPAPAKAPRRQGGGARASGSFDAAFLESQRALLMEERANLLGQAERLEDEAAELMEDLDPGDVQFDDESGEGDTLVVERERDLALSAQARQTVSEIDAALARIKDGTYGLSVVSGRPIPKERLQAIPWATELVEEKVGGLGTRR